jgi:hypothetical protein
METKPMVLEFGNGKIAVCATEFGWLLYKQVEESHEVGEDDPSCIGQSIEEYDPELIFTFSCVESIDVLVDLLMIARKRIAGGADEAVDE